MYGMYFYPAILFDLINKSFPIGVRIYTMKYASEIAKISRPSLRNVLERKIRLARLESALQSPVIWVTGPAGSGKTTLVSDFVRSRKKSCLWYQVDERDEEPATFFYYMALAAKKASPKSKKKLPEFSPEYLSGLMAFTINFFEKVFEKLKKGSLLVFDNYQMLHEDAQLHSLMQKGLSIIPQSMNIIIISRNSPPKDLTGFLANNTMDVLQWEDLQLNLDETRDILALRSNQNYSKENVQLLHEITNGWVSGLTLWVQASLYSPLVSVKDTSYTPEEIFDYFASEIFSNTSPEIRHFLLTTSFLPKMNISMADEISGITNSRVILLRLVRQQYFIFKYGDSKRFYAYHQLFRSFLQARALESLSIVKLSHYRKTAARLLVENGDIDEAASLLVKCQAFDELAELIMVHSLSLIEQARHTLVLKWLNMLPKEMFKINAWLIFWQGAAELVIDPEMSCRRFEAAFQFFSTKEDSIGKLLSWSGIIDATILQFGSIKGLDKWIRVIEQIEDDYLSVIDKHIQKRVASSIFKALVMRQPHHPDVEKWAEQALIKSNDKKTLSTDSEIYFRLQFYYLTIKIDIGKVKEIAAQLKKIAAQPYISPMCIINALYADLVSQQIQGRLQNSLAVIKKYRLFAEKSGIHLFDFFYSLHEASLYLDMSNIKKADAVLLQLHPHVDEMKPWEKNLYYLQNARAGFLAQKYRNSPSYSRVEEYINKAIEWSEYVGYPFTIFACMIQKVYIHQVRGCKKDAQDLLNEYFKLIKSQEPNQYQVMGLLAQAHLFFESGKERKGIAVLREGLAMGKQHGLYFTFSDQPAITAKLCLKALVEEIEVPYVQTIIKKRHFQPETPPVYLTNWPWPVKIQSFGSFEIYLNDKPIHLSRKSPKKIFKLLKAIIAYHNEKVPIIWLMDSLWPDADGDRAMDTLKVSIKRLRKLLGNSQAVLWEKSAVWLNPRLVWVDLAAFESINQDLSRQTKHRTDSGSMVNKIRSAVKLAKGQFLEGDDSLPVFIARRSELEILFVNLFKLAVTHETSDQKLSEIITLCNKTVRNPDLSQAIQNKIIPLVSQSKNGIS
jgi:ATP/maltotriose-dependent transcriptional regulator MalT